LQPPSLPLTPAVTMQLHNGQTGACWGARFDAGIRSNASDRFSARD
jgi:hypothetical protein